MQEIKDKKIISQTAMEQVKTLPMTWANSSTAIKFAALLLVAVFAPIFSNQYITGTLVNATLFLAVSLIGLKGAILIGALPSIVSLATGLIALAIAPMAPFIIFSNALLVSVFAGLRNKNYWIGVVSASVLKFLFLSAVSSFVIGNFVSSQIASKIAVMMSYPQLFTALSGGILAYGILSVLGKNKR